MVSLLIFMELHMTIKELTLFALSLTFFGCTSPRVDGTNIETFSKSLQEVNTTLPIRSQFELQKAIKIISLNAQRSQSIKNLENHEINLQLLNTLDGLTSMEIIGIANNISPVES